ncbi:MAG TPA: MBL fold metallo-hydrolase [Aggregatilineales bacterium]|jgi:glyoxylase-like metal-dependent hydrolase (beta-lactamase superfamily II)|nr:MBL fold metallo-hydrolase [Aggregatilineales bacterium]
MVTIDCTDLPHGISTIDTGYYRPGFDASHLIVEKDGAALVDVGTSFSAPRILRVLQGKGIAFEAVRYVMVTHVHLDHAGGAGALLQHLPNAQLVAHPRGAPHLIDPTKLIEGATAVYGEERFRALYGEIVPVAVERVIAAPDNFELSLTGRPLLFLDTPGHARHHYCIYDAASRGIFSGDTFGLSYREFDSGRGPFIFPTTTPVQFDPEALHASIERLLSFNPVRMYLTHYGCVEDVPRLAADLHGMIDAMVTVATEADNSGPDRHALLTAGLNDLLLDALRAHGCNLPDTRILQLLAADVELNAQGLAIWLDKRDKAAAHA